MTLSRKGKAVSIIRKGFEISAECHLRSCKTLFSTSGSFHIAHNPRSYATKATAEPKRVARYCIKSSDDTDYVVRITPSVRKTASLALLDYFYGTRGLQFIDAENMSKNAPHFLEDLLKKINIEADIEQSVTRFLRYHPVNEFEPFLESLGLKPSEYLHLLPRDKMFLNEDALFLENHDVLCSYGIARKSIGKIYKDATKIFGYDRGVLASKIRAYENLGFSHSFLSKVFVCSPRILIGDTNRDFVEVLEILKSMGFDISWVMQNLSEDALYNWSMMNKVLSLFREMGFGEDELSGLIKQHPTLIFENSGESTLTLVGLQTKFGSSMSEIHSMFQQFPQFQLGKFFKNLRRCFLFLSEIEMKADEIGKILRSHSFWLGTCSLKKTSSLLRYLYVGKKRLCQVVQENPQEMRKWVFGSKVERLPNTEEAIKSKILKTKFLVDLGYAENSKELDKAHKIFRCKGSEIRERFDFLVKVGFDEKDVSEMVKASPKILSQSKDLLKAKIDYLINQLGYPASVLVKYPSYLNYNTQRVKLRFSMYFWLRDRGKAEPGLALSTILACSNNFFFKKYVTRHFDGPEVWEDLKKQICSG